MKSGLMTYLDFIVGVVQTSKYGKPIIFLSGDLFLGTKESSPNSLSALKINWYGTGLPPKIQVFFRKIHHNYLRNTFQPFFFKLVFFIESSVVFLGTSLK